MAKTINNGYTDTAIAGNPVLTYPRGSVNFATDFRVKSNKDNEVVITNLTSPVDRPENFRIAYTPVSNIYTGTGIEASVTAPTKQGVSILVQLTEVISVTDSAAPEYRVDLPLSCHLVIKVPRSEHVTAATVQTMVGRLLSGLYDTGVSTTARLDAILRGSLISKEL